MSQDLRNQADWLASEGFVAAAPDLFAGHNHEPSAHDARRRIVAFFEAHLKRP